jgi:ATP-dependent Lon protease
MELNCGEPNIKHVQIEKAVITIQRAYREKKEYITQLNEDLYFIYYCLLGIMKRLRDSFRYEVLTQYHYYHNMEKLEDVLKLFSTIPRPVTMSYLYKNKIPDLDDIQTRMIDIVQKCGALTIFDIIKLNLKVNPDIINTRLLNFYNKVFNPIGCQIYDINQLNDQKYPNLNENNAIAVYNTKNKFDMHIYDMKTINNLEEPLCNKIIKHKKTLVEHVRGGRLYIPIKFDKINMIIVMNGYFIEDSLNISRLGGIMEKKNKHLQMILSSLDINKSFKEGYIEQLSLRDFVIFSNPEISSRCLEAYNECNKLSKKTFSSLVKEFINTDAEKQRYILTLFLLMKDNKQTQYLAYSLYDMISNESYLLKPQSIGEKIFNSLHWSIQKRFKVVMNQITKYSQELNNFTEEDVSFKKRILLMKAPEHIKRKAMEKYKEINSKGANDNSSKPQQYLEGLLKIPFGVYRKEYIVNFLSDFQPKIQHFIFVISEYLERKDINNKYLTNIQYNVVNFQLMKYPYTSHDIHIIIDKLYTVYSKWNRLSVNMDDLSDEEILIWIKQILFDGTIIDLKQLIKSFNKKHNLSVSVYGIKKKLVNNLIDNGQLGYNQLAKFIQSDQFVNSVSMKLEDVNNHNKLISIKSEWENYRNSCKHYINDVDKILDSSIYGQDDAKVQIKRIIGQWINGENDGYCLGFEGYPGTGKTSLAKQGIANCLKDDDGSSRPFAFIALGGSTHGATLEGHSYTYVGSTWGEMANVLMESQCMNPIIFIDELDKVSQTEHGKEIIGILTHLTDSSQNTEFCDKYFNVKMDLSKCLIIFSYNDASKIDPILADRIHKIQFKPLSLSDKIIITRDYLLPELIGKIGFNTEQLIFSEKVIEYLIQHYTYEAGVRKLKKIITEILREINLKYLQTDNICDIEITKDLIETILPANTRFKHKKINLNPQIGTINGMFATPLGLGGLTIIQTCFTPAENKLNLQLTGQQGDVMQESMKVAKTLALRIVPLNILKKLMDDMDDTGKMGIHIHCPEGATQKDGPSAGMAITLALISLLTNLPVLNTVAMTGEIDMMGNVLPIGGLDIKITGAKLAGVKTIICPQQNKDDLDEIKTRTNTIIDDSIEIIMVNNIWQGLDIIFPENNIKFRTGING